MSATIDIDGTRCEVTDGVWVCPGNPAMTSALNEFEAFHQLTKTSGPGPDQDNLSASMMVERFGGEVIRTDLVATPEPGRVS